MTLYRSYTLDELSKSFEKGGGLPFGRVVSTGPGRTGPSAGQDILGPTNTPFSAPVKHDPRKKPEHKKGTVYLPLDMPGSGITKSDGFVKPYPRTRRGKLEQVKGHRRKLPLMEAMVWQVAKDHGLSHGAAKQLVTASLTINDQFTGIKHELDPELMVLRVDLPNGTSLVKKHDDFNEARKTLTQLREYQKLVKNEWDKYATKPPETYNLDDIRNAYAGVLKRAFGFEDEKKISPPEHIVFRTGVPEGFKAEEFNQPEHTYKEIGTNHKIVGIVDVDKEGKYRVSAFAQQNIFPFYTRKVLEKKGFSDKDKAKEGLSKLMGEVQKKALLAKELQSTLDERLQSEVRNWEQAVKYTKANKLEEAAKEAKAELKKVKEQIKTQEDLKRELGLGKALIRLSKNVNTVKNFLGEKT